jgi:hypothetical protein
MASHKFLSNIADPNTVITPIDTAIRFPEILTACQTKYRDDIGLFKDLIQGSSSSAELLDKIRQKAIPANTRMSLLKMFRRCVAPVLDTETTKKISKVSTASLVDNYGKTFKEIVELQKQFSGLSADGESALAALIGEYDTRGQVGYLLTDMFFSWFEETHNGKFVLDGPRGAGPDVELSSIFPEFSGSYPCDFVVRSVADKMVNAVGFARYDSTRGGAQSDDRTGGNANKVDKARSFCEQSGNRLKIIFLADGPGLGHRDTWEEACSLDGKWSGNVRVTTLKTAPERITEDWLQS